MTQELSLASSAETPMDRHRLVARAKAMVPRLRELASETETSGRVSDTIAAELIEAGFFRIAAPRRFGGYGLRHSVLWEVARHIASGCPSTGWILGLIGISPWIVGLLDPAAQEEVFASGNPIVPILTGGNPQFTSAREVEGGYELIGTWRYASGIDLADWVIAMGPVSMGEGKPAGDPRIFLVPRRAFEVDHDSWKVLGMRGTGSKNVNLPSVFVPAHRSISWVDAQAGKFPGSAVNDDPMYKMPLNALFAASVAAPIVGTAFGVADAYIESMKGRTRANGQRQGLESYSQIEIGLAAAQIDMAFALLVKDAEEMYEVVEANNEFTLLDRARYRAHAASCCRAVVEASDRLFTVLGGALLPFGTPTERLFRDIHAMASHFLMQPQVAGEIYGSTLLGLELPASARV